MVVMLCVIPWFSATCFRDASSIMMQDNGYIKGIVVTKNLGDMKRHIAEPICPEITIVGLEYLEENKFMRKAANMLKGAADIVK